MFSVVSRWSHVWRVSSYAAKWSWPLVSLKSVHLSSATGGNWWLQRLMQMDRLIDWWTWAWPRLDRIRADSSGKILKEASHSERCHVGYVCENMGSISNFRISPKMFRSAFLQQNHRVTEYIQFILLFFPSFSPVRFFQFLLSRPKVKHKASWQTTCPWRVSSRRSPSFTPTAPSGAQFHGVSYGFVV